MSEFLVIPVLLRDVSILRWVWRWHVECMSIVF